LLRHRRGANVFFQFVTASRVWLRCPLTAADVGIAAIRSSRLDAISAALPPPSHRRRKGVGVEWRKLLWTARLPLILVAQTAPDASKRPVVGRHSTDSRTYGRHLFSDGGSTWIKSPYPRREFRTQGFAGRCPASNPRTGARARLRRRRYPQTAGFAHGCPSAAFITASSTVDVELQFAGTTGLPSRVAGHTVDHLFCRTLSTCPSF